jgi:hypothetical protein
MVVLSAILYFLVYHPFLSMPLIILAGLIVSAVLAQLSRRRKYYLLIIPFYLCSQVNVFAGHFLNALFLNAFGTRGTAVIVHSQETDSQLNNKNVWAYDAVLKTANDRDVVVHFDTLSASIYPIRNAILIPPENESFVAKYIPGFERNICIMSDESDYGKRIIVDQDRGPVEKAGGQYAVSPANPAFINEYRNALQTFIVKHRDDADPDLIQQYQEQLNDLSQAGEK